jgi:hypothetical protein
MEREQGDDSLAEKPAPRARDAVPNGILLELLQQVSDKRLSFGARQ